MIQASFLSRVQSVLKCALMHAVQVFAVLFFSGFAHAEYLGLVNGRSAAPGGMPDFSIELGFVGGDLGSSDYQIIGARLNYRPSNEVVIHGDIGVSEFGESDGTPFGLGILYHLSNQRISQSVEIAGKASYHTGEFKVGDVNGDLRTLALEVLISGARPLVSTGLNWYSNVGFHRISFKLGGSDTSNELGIGGGFVLPTGLGEAYVGVDYVDEIAVGLGFRYFVQ